jgi:hypothetical protein
MNDATIFRYVLKTDTDLNKLCQKKENIMFFVDRGAYFVEKIKIKAVLLFSRI